MHTVEKTIEIESPVKEVFDQWARFQDFPKFMKGIKDVRRLDDKHLQWTAGIGGTVKSWNSEIIEQVPNRRIRWRSTSGAENSGTVTFISLTPARTRLILYLSYDPAGFLEYLGDNLGLVATMVIGDLKRFKAHVESVGVMPKTRRLAAVPVPSDT